MRAVSSSLVIFLSTLSLRRATCHISVPCGACWHFYPRSPCGERLLGLGHSFRHNTFLSTLSLRRATGHLLKRYRNMLLFLSTLSLRRATIMTTIICTALKFLSTLSLRRATLGALWVLLTQIFLSTLSLRRATGLRFFFDVSLFLSTLSLRRATLKKFPLMCTIKHFYPRSPCGERLATRQ